MLFRRNLNYVIEKNKTFIEYVNVFGDKKVDYSLVEKKIKSEILIDPDCWVVEIEDKNGKNYFLTVQVFGCQNDTIIFLHRQFLDDFFDSERLPFRTRVRVKHEIHSPARISPIFVFLKFHF